MPNESTELVNVSLRLPRDLLEALDRRARSIDRGCPNRSAAVRSALERQLAKEIRGSSDRRTKENPAAKRTAEVAS